MAVVYKLLGRSSPSSTGAVDVYTVPVAKQTILSMIAVTALDATRPTLTIDVRPGGTAAANATKLVKDAVITPGRHHQMGRGITLAAGTVVTISASAADKVTVMLFGTEIDL